MLNATADERKHIMSVIDPFCEKRFWEIDQNVKTHITNPVSAGTGLIILLMAVCTTNIEMPSTQAPITGQSITAFHLCKASLGIVGAGTVIFHSIDDTMPEFTDLNASMCDWLPIVLMCTNIMVLYISRFERHASERRSLLIYTPMYGWACVLILAMDSRTHESMTRRWHNPNDAQNTYGTLLNIALLVPLGITLTIASYYHLERRHSMHIWGCVAVNIALWVGNAYGCSDTLWLSMLHALYHVTIAYTFLCAACAGMTIDGAWAIDFRLYAWPMIRPRMEEHDPSEGKHVTSIINSPSAKPGHESTKNVATPCTGIRIDPMAYTPLIDHTPSWSFFVNPRD